MAIRLSTIFLLCLYGYMCYACDDMQIRIQGGVVAAIAVAMDLFWSPSSTLEAFSSASRKADYPGHSIAALLFPILVLAAKGPHLHALHSLAAVQAIASCLAFSCRSAPLLSTLAVAAAVLAGTGSPAYSTADVANVLRSGVSVAVLQVALLVPLRGTFTMGEAAFLANCLVALKMLWGLAEWTFVARLSYILWLSSLMGLLLAFILGSQAACLRNIGVMGAAVLGGFLGGLRLSRIGLADVQAQLVGLALAPGSGTVFALWAAGFAVLGLLVYVFGRMEVSSDDRAALQLMRKSFHFVALFMFMPAGFYNFELLKLGLAAAACLFVAIEFARKTCPDSVLVSGVSPFCLKLEPHGGQGESADGNDDAEVVVVSHLLLLLGCALPIWVTQASNSVHAYAGIFALCVVDSSAAIIGALLGEHPWPGSRKTAEGTLGSMVATYVFLSFVFNVVLFEQPLPDLPAILAFAVLLPAWEACSCQNDNITLPVVGLAVSHLLF